MHESILTAWKRHLAVLLLLAAGASGCSADKGGGGPTPTPTVSAKICAAVAAVAPAPNALTMVVVDDQSRSGLVRGAPPALAANLTIAQAKGWTVTFVGVNGANATPLLVGPLTLDPQPGVESANADRARAAALTCAERMLTDPRLAPTAPRSDILAALTAGARQRPARMLIVSDGVATAGGLDLGAIGYDAAGAGVAAALRSAHQLPELGHLPVVWTDLGETAIPLPEPARLGLRAVWTAVLQAAGGSVRFDTRVTPAGAGDHPLATAVDPMPKVETSITGLGPISCATVPTGILFAPDSARLDDVTALRPVAELLRAHPSWAALIAGHTADYGPAAGQFRLSLLRAQAVAQALRKLVLPAAVELRTVGYGSTRPAAREWTANGHDEVAASRNRRVVIGLGDPVALNKHECG